MVLELKQQLRLTQQLVMTPQLQQAIKLLQLSRLELVNLVQKELEENPVLEEAAELEPGEASAEGSEGSDAPAEASSEVAAVAEESAAEASAAEASAATDEVAPGEEREPTDAEKVADVDWQSYLDAYPQTGMREARGNDDRPAFETTLTRRATLSEHLLWQLQMDSIPEEEETAAQFIIGNLDDRGYLR